MPNEAKLTHSTACHQRSIAVLALLAALLRLKARREKQMALKLTEAAQ